MNKIFSMFCIALSVAIFTACSDDTNNPYDSEPTVDIVKSDVDFPAKASYGFIQFNADGVVSVQSSADWCTVELQNDSVKVSVEQNVSVSGRTAVVNLTCNDVTTNVAVTQAGVVVDFGTYTIVSDNDDADTLYQHINSNVDLVIDNCPEWVKASLDNTGEMTVVLTENNTQHIRDGYIKVRSGEFTDSVKVVQCDFDKDIAGDYTLYYTTEKGKERSTKVTLNRNGIYLKSNRLTIPVSYDQKNVQIVMECGQYCGKVSTDYIFVHFATEIDQSGGFQHSQYETGLYIYGNINYGQLTRNEGKVGNYFSIGGYFYESTMVDGLFLWKYKEPELCYDADTGEYLMGMYNPYLERVIE